MEFVLAAVVYEGGSASDDLMARVVAKARADGLDVRGVLQDNRGGCADNCFSMSLADIASGETVSITDDSVRGKGLCRLDPAGLAAASRFLDPSRVADADLVVVSKFGRQEAEGRGFREELAAVLATGRPVLTSVRRDFVEAFDAYVGIEWTSLPCDEAEILGWAHRVAANASVP